MYPLRYKKYPLRYKKYPLRYIKLFRICGAGLKELLYYIND